MSDNDVRKTPAYLEEAGRIPDFEHCWAAAERRYALQKSRRIAAASIASLVGLTLAIVLQVNLRPQADDTYLIADALLNSTSWEAPSDAFFPQHTFDIYGDLSLPAMSTVTKEGSLL